VDFLPGSAEDNTETSFRFKEVVTTIPDGSRV